MRRYEDIRWDSGGENRLDALLGIFPVLGLRDGAVLVVGVASGLLEGGISETAGLRWKSEGEGVFKVHEEFIFIHGLLSVGGNGGKEGGVENRFEMGKEL